MSAKDCILRAGVKYHISKKTITNELDSQLPTVKQDVLIIRPKYDPIGDWKLTKPTRKEEYFVELLQKGRCQDGSISNTGNNTG